MIAIVYLQQYVGAFLVLIGLVLVVYSNRVVSVLVRVSMTNAILK
jgi:hypothetical protein